MGKTFVALAVAVSVALDTKSQRPVVVMVPPSLKEKWPQDFSVFREKCCTAGSAETIRPQAADSAVALLRILEAPAERRCSIIFLTHGAMHRGLSDGWIKLAIIQRAMRGRHHTGQLRAALSRCAGPLLRLGWADQHPDIWDRLLDRPSEDWPRVLDQYAIPVTRSEADAAAGQRLMPVPTSVARALQRMDTSDLSDVYDALHELPQKKSSNYPGRVAEARKTLTDKTKHIWKECVTSLRLRLPLLIMDEAHHLKNPKTRLSGLFVPESQEDAEEISKGVFGGVFERMLFLTATPFQLGHHELCSVLSRFSGVHWDVRSGKLQSRETFEREIKELRSRLDAAQLEARNLDHAWGRLRADDLQIGGASFDNPEEWWNSLQNDSVISDSGRQVRTVWRLALEKMRAAEEALRPWVIRHLKPDLFQGKPRRQRLPGDAIVTGTHGTDRGIEVSGAQLLPFLLAARATFHSPESRPVFAEGLASSYATFLETRKGRSIVALTDGDDDPIEVNSKSDIAGEWYLDQLEKSLPKGHGSSALHPKLRATALRVMGEWRRGEKVLVFCHYIRTGHVLQEFISGLMRTEIRELGSKKFGCRPEQVEAQLESLGRRFFDKDSPASRTCNREVGLLLESYPSLAPHRARLLAVSRKYIRTPSFLVRYFPPLKRNRVDEASIQGAFLEPDGSGLSLRQILNGFFSFLDVQCGEEELRAYLDAIERLQTGAISGHEVKKSFAEDELDRNSGRLMPNVRLANGSTSADTRRRLMLTFNSPFFPEVLVASNVLAEGVDLHRFCRYVIHHDLCWSPSTLEQRTGRVDRIGAKVEQCGEPIIVYLPYIAETQDEKMYRVVTDRERWFSVVMGHKFATDARTTEHLAQRIPLPETVAKPLALRLEVAPHRDAVPLTNQPADVGYSTSPIAPTTTDSVWESD